MLCAGDGEAQIEIIVKGRLNSNFSHGYTKLNVSKYKPITEILLEIAAKQNLCILHDNYYF